MFKVCVSLHYMSQVPARHRPKRRKTTWSRQVAACTGLRHSAPVARRQLRTADYPESARIRLGRAVEAARRAANFPSRPAFAKAAGVSKRSLVDLEQGNAGIGQKTLFAVAQALSGWNEETPRLILEGGEPPALPEAEVPEQEPSPVAPAGDLPDYSHLTPDERRRIIRMSIDQLPLVLPVGQDAYEAVRDSVIRLIVKYEPREGDD